MEKVYTIHKKIVEYLQKESLHPGDGDNKNNSEKAKDILDIVFEMLFTPPNNKIDWTKK